MANPISDKKSTLTVPKAPGDEKIVGGMCKSGNPNFLAQCEAYKKGALDSYNGFMQNAETGMKFIFETLKDGKLNGTTVDSFASIQGAVKECKKLPTSLTEDLFTPEKAPAIFKNLQACVDGIAKAKFVAAPVVAPAPVAVLAPAPAGTASTTAAAPVAPVAPVAPAPEKAKALEALPAIGLGELMESFLMEFGKSLGTDYSNAVAMFKQGEEKKSWEYVTVLKDMKDIAAGALQKYTENYGPAKKLNALQIPSTVKVDGTDVKITEIVKGDEPKFNAAYDAMMAEAGKTYDAYFAHAKEVLGKDPATAADKINFAAAESGAQAIDMLKAFEASAKKQYDAMKAGKKKAPAEFPKALADQINALPATEAEWMDKVAKPAVQKWLDRNDQFILKQKDFVINFVLGAGDVADFKKNLNILVNGINGALFNQEMKANDDFTNARLSADENAAGIVYQSPPAWNPNSGSKENAVNFGRWLRLQAVREKVTVDDLLAAMQYKSKARKDADGSPSWMNLSEFMVEAGSVKTYIDYKNLVGKAKAYIAGSQAPGVTNSYDVKHQGGSFGVGVGATKMVGKTGELAWVINGGVESSTSLPYTGLPGYGDLVGTEKEESGNQLGITFNVGAAYGKLVFGKKRTNQYGFAVGAFGGNIGGNFKVMHFVDPNVCIVAGGEYYYGNFKPLADDGDRLLPSHAHSISLGTCFFPGTDSVKIDVGAKLAGNKDNPLSAAITPSVGVMVDVSDDGWAIGATDKIGVPLRTNIGRDWSPVLNNTLEIAVSNEDPDPTFKNVKTGVRWTHSRFKGVTGGGYGEELVSKDDRLTVFGEFDTPLTSWLALSLNGELGGAIRSIPGITGDNNFMYGVGVGFKVLIQ